MIRFDCDYLEGAHKNIMDALNKSNYEQTCGYAEDEYCKKARELIKKECETEDADVHFLVGGTQANTTVIAAALKPYQSVVCVESGHINMHECGAIEGTGHKVTALKGKNGKIQADILKKYLDNYLSDPAREHIVQPAMIYISQPTETGTLYTAEELRSLRDVCDEYSLYIYVDGARLGYGLAAKGNDVTLPLLAELTDVFYIGGTKVGALFGEAVVIVNDSLKKDFRCMQKRQGGMFAKGRLLGIQFLEMFRDGLYYKLGQNGTDNAMRIKKAFSDKGYEFLCDSPTNQQFPILPDEVIKKFDGKFACEYWCRVDDGHSCVRFCTSWATTKENTDALIKFICDL